MAFQLDKNTTIEGSLRVGASADVTYRQEKGANVAISVHVRRNSRTARSAEPFGSTTRMIAVTIPAKGGLLATLPARRTGEEPWRVCSVHTIGSFFPHVLFLVHVERL